MSVYIEFAFRARLSQKIANVFLMVSIRFFYSALPCRPLQQLFHVPYLIYTGGFTAFKKRLAIQIMEAGFVVNIDFWRWN